MKTGFICASGFNLIASATRGDRRLIAIVLGAPSSAARAAKAAALLEQGFNNGTGLSWLLPSLGTVDALQPINAAPPDLHDEICNHHRRHQAAENEDDEAAANNGDADSQRAFMLSDLKGSTHGSLLTGNPLAAVPPMVVYTGAQRPTGSGEAEADAALLKSNKAKKTKHSPKTAAKPKNDPKNDTKTDPKSDTKTDTKADKSAKPKPPKTAQAKPKATPASQ
jgi:D-alanyl-D-alanine carboxypeptidase